MTTNEFSCASFFGQSQTKRSSQSHTQRGVRGTLQDNLPVVGEWKDGVWEGRGIPFDEHFGCGGCGGGGVEGGKGERFRRSKRSLRGRKPLLVGYAPKTVVTLIDLF